MLQYLLSSKIQKNNTDCFEGDCRLSSVSSRIKRNYRVDIVYGICIFFPKAQCQFTRIIPFRNPVTRPYKFGVAWPKIANSWHVIITSPADLDTVYRQEKSPRKYCLKHRPQSCYYPTDLRPIQSCYCWMSCPNRSRILSNMSYNKTVYRNTCFNL